jgi:hypothetical protein
MRGVSTAGIGGINGTNDVREARVLYSATVNAHPAVMSRAAFLAATDALIHTGDELVSTPDWDRFRAWLIESDALLERVWGRMDRYHLAWLNVGRGSAPPGASLDDAGTRRFIAEVAGGKLAVLRTMRASVERQGWTLLSDDDPSEENR